MASIEPGSGLSGFEGFWAAREAAAKRQKSQQLGFTGQECLTFSSLSVRTLNGEYISVKAAGQ
jgi:hypothetical protein